MTYCKCETPIMDVEYDAGCRRCGLPVDFSNHPTETDALVARSDANALDALTRALDR